MIFLEPMNNKPLTKKQIIILLLLYKFRFLHTYQFQKLLNHTYPNRIKVWLKQLTTTEYIHRNYEPNKFGNKQPAIYYLTKKARKIIKEQKKYNQTTLNKIYREQTRSQTFIDHCLLIADTYLSLQSQLKKNQSLYFATQTDLEKHEYLPKRLIDAYIAITKSKTTKRYFLEIIDDTLSKGKIIAKVQKYLKYAENNLWEENTETPFPSVLIICPNEQIKKWLQRKINQKLEEEQTEILFIISITLPVL